MRSHGPVNSMKIRLNGSSDIASDVTTFACDACGRKFAWKAELAGRALRCKCGAAMTVPSREMMRLPESNTYDLGDDELTALPTAAKLAPVLAYAAPATPALNEAIEPEEGTAWRNIYLPAVLVICGAGIEFTRLMHGGSSTSEGGMSALEALKTTGFSIVWNVGVLL